ncbi:hypothetical protein [Micromonospora pisi]|uniref:hypothetical protein n=1 Tax=Micromonospora pisi TaxID=589240 RepID=UPI000EB1CEC2|nr:hypothetical protein [Micromonospora pisi]
MGRKVDSAVSGIIARKADEVFDTADVPGSARGVPPAGRGGWPPSPPTGPKPPHGATGAAEWRYQRYLHQAHSKGKTQDQVLPFDKWKTSHYDPAAAGGRPGRRGGSEQVAAKEYLAEHYGVQEVENVQLGPQWVDGVRPNATGGTDYFEVGAMTQGGLPEARERVKLANEVPALGENDTLQFVDKSAPSEDRWIRYSRSDDPMTKRYVPPETGEG